MLLLLPRLALLLSTTTGATATTANIRSIITTIAPPPPLLRHYYATTTPGVMLPLVMDAASASYSPDAIGASLSSFVWSCADTSGRDCALADGQPLDVTTTQAVRGVGVRLPQRCRLAAPMQSYVILSTYLLLTTYYLLLTTHYILTTYY
jgi:hypothetical protein